MNNNRKMQDMIPSDKRSIRRVPLGTTRQSKPIISNEKTSSEENSVQVNTESSTISPPRPPHHSMLQKKKGKGVRILLLLFAVFILVFIVFNIFSGATISVIPHQEDITIDGTFTADVSSGIDVLEYELFTIHREDGELVPATGVETISTRASGTIVVFNDFSTTDQLLVENTRFRTPNGLIYRIQEPLRVPGQTTDASGETVPGSIDVRVVADKVGQEYNIGLTDFNIPGFEESGDQELFESFFARSKTLMTGGFDGTRKTVDDTDAQAARKTLNDRINTQLLSALSNELPKNFIAYEDGIFTTFREGDQESEEDERDVLLKQNGTLHAIVFMKENLASFVAYNTVAAYDGSSVNLLKPENLTFAMIKKDDFDSIVPSEFEFTLSGQDTLVWQFDEDRLKNDLASKHRNDIPTILSAYPAIEEADIALYPFWRRTFPQKAQEIKIKYE